MSSLRIFFRGGWFSYRALFGWLSPWVLIPTFIIAPLFQIAFFATIGQSAGVASNEFYLLGNAVVAAAIPCLFGAGNTISGERFSQTLGLLLVSPARRVPLFLGRTLPVIANGFVVAVFSLVVGAWLLRVSLPASTLPELIVVLAISAFSVTGLGVAMAALALRVRESAVLANIVLGILLVFCGVNVALSALPTWMSSVAAWLPLTHGIEAARGIAAGVATSVVWHDLGVEFLIGIGYVIIGMGMIRYFEYESRRNATLERV